MTDRSAGYVTDLGYTRNYQPALNPWRSRLAFLHAGLAPPAIRTACELGFGQGVSLAVHAAAGTAAWWGNDLLAEHVASAATLVRAAGADAVVAEATFAEFAGRPDLPAFDFIGLHGVLSWVSAANRAVIAAFLRDHLAPGGVVYTGYNALPGWNELVPLRGLLAAHAARGPGDTAGRIAAALAFAGRVLAAAPRALGPEVVQRFERLRRADPRYLAHEYFNRDWQPLAFADVAALMATAGLVPACPAAVPDAIAGLRLTPAQQAVLAGIDDVALCETTRDFLGGTSFRQDYWVRTPVPLDATARVDAWRAERVVLVTDPADLPDRVTGPGGDVRLDESCCRQVVARLADQEARSVAELAEGLPLAGVTDAVFRLAALGHASTAVPAEAARAARPRTAALNRQLGSLSDPAGPGVLASPVTGGGVPVDEATLGWMAARAAGREPREPRAQRRLAALRALGILD